MLSLKDLLVMFNFIPCYSKSWGYDYNCHVDIIFITIREATSTTHSTANRYEFGKFHGVLMNP